MRKYRKSKARRSTIVTTNLVFRFLAEMSTFVLWALRNIRDSYVASVDFSIRFSILTLFTYIGMQCDSASDVYYELWNQTDEIGIFSAGMSVARPQTVSATGGCNIKYLAISHRMHGLHECKSGSRRGCDRFTKCLIVRIMHAGA